MRRLHPDLFDEFVAESGRIRTPASERSFRSVVFRLQEAHPDRPAARFTESDLVEFCLSGGVAPRTVLHRRTVLSVVFQWAHWKGYCPSDPSAGLSYLVKPGKNTVRRPVWLEEPEVADVIRSCPDTFVGRRDRLALMFGFMMGLRLSTISDLRWDQFSEDLSVLEVVVKGNKATRKGVPQQLRQDLLRWRSEAPRGAVAVLPGLHSHGVVSRAPEPSWEAPLGRTGVSDAVKRAGQRCGLKITPHDMRRSLAGILETKGVPVTDIQRALDHSSVGTTSVYLDQNPGRTQAVTERITIEL